MAYPRRVVTQHQRDVITAHTHDEAARILGISKSTVSAICRSEGIHFAQKIGRGGMRRGQLADDVRGLWNADYSVAHLCDRYDLRASAVCAMLGIETLSGISLYLGKSTLRRLADIAHDEALGIDWMAARMIAGHPMMVDGDDW